ncbi:MAG: hypothetical protein H6Q77_2566 [Gemmatimonadetes bacterium]|nr:hypothetical protein [Gemmatimonadota bacterium]
MTLFSRSRTARPTSVALLMLAGLTVPLLAQSSKYQKQYQDRVLGVQALAGQIVAVVPITFIGADSSLKGDSALALYWNRTAGLRHFDSLFGNYLTGVLLETKWVLPPELRKLNVRSSGYFPDPDLMGQGAMRNPAIKKKVPEPLESKLRAISGVTNARVIIIPAGVVFDRDSTGMLLAKVSVVLVDPRLGDIKYRTITTGKGVTPDAALRSAFAIMVPPESLPE